MSIFENAFSLGEIIETIYPKLSDDVKFALTDDELGNIVDFCIDSKGDVRIGSGFVSMSVDTDDNPEYLPRSRYELKQSPWNSHSLYFEIELPNPADDFEFYTLIRTAMLAELKKRIQRYKKNAQARISHENKKKLA